MTSDEVDVAAILQESINSSVVDRNRIVMDYGNEKLCMYADEGWIVECFINLLDNCAEYLCTLFLNLKTGKMTSLCLAF